MSNAELRDCIATALERAQMIQRNRGSEKAPIHMIPVKSQQEQIRELQEAADQHRADLQEQADAVLAVLSPAASRVIDRKLGKRPPWPPAERYRCENCGTATHTLWSGRCRDCRTLPDTWIPCEEQVIR